MQRRTMVRILCAHLALSGMMLAQTEAPQEYIDLYVVKVKPEKRQAYEAAIKKLVAANRAQQGDYWLAYTPVFGGHDTIYFGSARSGMASIEPAVALFEKAVEKAYGQAGMLRLFGELSAASSETRGELRRRRPELSVNMPESREGLFKMLGQTRWLSVTTSWLRPGKTGAYVEQLRISKEALDKASEKVPVAISQSMAGPMAYYSVTYAKSLAEFDRPNTLMKALGQDAYQKRMQVTSESVIRTEREICRFVPELSHPMPEIAAADPEFWKPKPPPMRESK